MNKKRIASLLIVFVLLLSLLPVGASAEGFSYTWDPENGGPHCKSLFLVNLDTGAVAYSMNADEQLPMASLTKIMTYIVAYENIPDIENTVITVPESVATELAGTGSSIAEIPSGEELTGLQLLNLMMIPSGNDAALTLAKYVDSIYAQGGTIPQKEGKEIAVPETAETSESGESGDSFDPTDYTGTYFIAAMNAKAAELGCENTHFTNPHGLHNADHYTTARDMYKIVQYAMTLPNFTEITGSASYELPPTNIRSEPSTVYSTNKMFSQYEADGEYYYAYATGIKTGSHNEAGYCIAASATADGYTYVCIALGSPMIDPETGEEIDYHGEMVDAKELFRWSLVNLEKKTVAAQGDLLGEVTLDYAWNKDKLQLVAADNAVALLPKSVNLSSITVSCDVPESVQAPVKKGDEIGTASLSYAGEVIATVPLVAAESVAKSSMLEGIVQGKAVLTSPWFLVIIAVIFALIIVYIILVVAYRRKKRQLRRVKRFRDM